MTSGTPLYPAKPIVTLVPFSGIQLLDLAFDLEQTPSLRRSFLERRDSATRLPDGSTKITFHALTGDDALDGPLVQHPQAGDDLYDINKIKALEPFLGKWVPVPYLRVRPGRGDLGEEILDQGPTLWSRARVVQVDETADGRRITHRVTFAFDTELARRVPNRPYLLPSHDDAKDQQEFRFAAKAADMAWFLAWPEQIASPHAQATLDWQQWVDDWLNELFKEFKQAQRPGRPLREEDFPHVCEHWARYLVLLELLDAALSPPKLKLQDTVSPDRRYEPVNVDLVLDIGNSRSCGILIEQHPDQKFDFNNSYPLRLRDLSRPELTYSDPFESRVEFAQAHFGMEHIARQAGRRAFVWPSLVRIGPEAVRMAAEAEGTEVNTGMSSPKRYLWSQEPVNQEWRFQDNDYSASGEEPAIARAVRRFITERGDVIRQIEAEELARLRRPSPGGHTPAVRSKFSRSALYGFMLAEVIAQALVQINAPSNRVGRKQADVHRRLRQIIITLPPATPLPEQRVMRSRAEGAVKLVFDLLGWTPEMPPGIADPQVVIRWDEASCAHLVWLYSEVTQKFSGQIAELFRLVGKDRSYCDDPAKDASNGALQPSMRIASIDIGGGTTDLMITTYYVQGNRTISPTQNFREGFKIAGDDILKAVIQRLIIPALERQISAAGARGVRELLAVLFGADRAGQQEQQKQLRRLFVNRLFVPLALAMLRAAESSEGMGDVAPRQVALPEFFDRTDGVTAAELFGEAVAAYVEAPARAAGAHGFSLADTAFLIDLAAIDRVIRIVMREVVGQLAEAIWALDCDLVLLTGRPSRLPTIADMLVELAPVPADRVLPMHRYPAGAWYPFRSFIGTRIDDPKTTAAVGGVLCVLAESQIQNFTLVSSRFLMRSTAKFIGEMEINGQILDEKLVFRDVDLDSRARTRPAEATISFNAPLFLGSRQLPLERWIATALYWLDFANPQLAQRYARPLAVTLERRDVDDDIDEDTPEARRVMAEAAKEEFDVREISDARGATLKWSDVVLRLQTMPEDSYWLDSGSVLAQ